MAESENYARFVKATDVAKKFITENPKTVTFVCGILTGVLLVWVL